MRDSIAGPLLGGDCRVVAAVHQLGLIRQSCCCSVVSRPVYVTRLSSLLRKPPLVCAGPPSCASFTKGPTSRSRARSARNARLRDARRGAKHLLKGCATKSLILASFTDTLRPEHEVQIKQSFEQPLNLGNPDLILTQGRCRKDRSRQRGVLCR
jgi:hypothetical protein